MRRDYPEKTYYYYKYTLSSDPAKVINFSQMLYFPRGNTLLAACTLARSPRLGHDGGA